MIIINNRLCLRKAQPFIKFMDCAYFLHNQNKIKNYLINLETSAPIKNPIREPTIDIKTIDGVIPILK